MKTKAVGSTIVAIQKPPKESDNLDLFKAVVRAVVHENIKDYKPPFSGSNYNPELDHKRLTTEIGRIRALMIDGKFRTLGEIATSTGDKEASISAQLRNLRKLAHGGYVVDKRRRGQRESGLFEYAVVI